MTNPVVRRKKKSFHPSVNIRNSYLLEKKKKKNNGNHRLQSRFYSQEKREREKNELISLSQKDIN